MLFRKTKNRTHSYSIRSISSCYLFSIMKTTLYIHIHVPVSKNLHLPDISHQLYPANVSLKLKSVKSRHSNYAGNVSLKLIFLYTGHKLHTTTKNLPHTGHHTTPYKQNFPQYRSHTTPYKQKPPPAPVPLSAGARGLTLNHVLKSHIHSTCSH